MNYKSIKITASVVLIVGGLMITAALSGCNKESTYFTDTPVIESYLHPGDYLNVTISRQTPFLSDVTYAPDDISNLTVQAEINDRVHTLIPLGDGKYVDSSTIVTEGGEYNLTFMFNSKEVSAYTVIPSKPASITQSVTEIYMERVDFSSGPPNPGSMPDPVEITWENSDGSYYLIVVENVEDVLDPIVDFGGDLPASSFIRPPTSTSSARLSPTQFQYFGRHRVILFHLQQDYAALFNDNSSSSQNLTNPSTSIVNGYGIFTGLNSDTLWLRVIEH